MYIYFYFFFLPAALIESFNGDAESVSDVPPPTGNSASLSLPLVLQPGISEPPQPLLPASAPSAPPPAPSLGPGSQQAAFGNPPALLQPPEVPVPHSTQFAANHQEFLPHPQAPQPLVPGLSVVAGASAPAAAVTSAAAAPPQPQSTTEPLPAMVQTLPLGANSVLTNNPTITITPTPSAAILQSSLVMGEQNLQWILNGATSSPQNQEQMVSIVHEHLQWGEAFFTWVICSEAFTSKGKMAVLSDLKRGILSLSHFPQNQWYKSRECCGRYLQQGGRETAFTFPQRRVLEQTLRLQSDPIRLDRGAASKLQKPKDVSGKRVQCPRQSRTDVRD